jgi:hypothetical protein
VPVSLVPQAPHGIGAELAGVPQHYCLESNVLYLHFHKRQIPRSVRRAVDGSFDGPNKPVVLDHPPRVVGTNSLSVLLEEYLLVGVMTRRASGYLNSPV